MLIPTRRSLAALGLAATLVAVPLTAPAQTDVGAQLDQILAGDHRNPKNSVRDKYRHPKETLLFFGIQPGMTVVEVWPSAGWWTEILAPLLKERGQYYAAYYATPAKDTPDAVKEREKAFDAMLTARPDLYGKVVKTYVLAPEFVDLAPNGAVDMVLTFRNVHNWAKAGNAQAMFQAFYDALKPGGVLGVEDHRAKPEHQFRGPGRSRLSDRGVRHRPRAEGRFQARGEIGDQRQPEGHQGPPVRGVDVAADARLG